MDGQRTSQWNRYRATPRTTRGELLTRGGTGMAAIPGWEVRGGTMINTNYIRLTPDVTDKSGFVVARRAAYFQTLELTIQFRVGSEQRKPGCVWAVHQMLAQQGGKAEGKKGRAIKANLATVRTVWRSGSRRSRSGRGRCLAGPARGPASR